LPTPGLIPIPEVPANPTPEQLQSAITAILQNISYLQSELQKLQPTTIQPFERDLYFGLINDSEVQRLQEFLINRGYLNITQSTGNYYSLTLAAVKAYQQAKNITPTSGYFGPKTRQAVNQDLGL
jgi:peptidoglycan hydrolase-like protein with peptidoglycan-binding domain